MCITVIQPVSDLRDYNKVLRECANSESVILTKNGRSAFVVMPIDEYNEMLKLFVNKHMGKVLQCD